MAIEFLKQVSGRFDRRFQIGPAIWDHFDLIWIHTGAVRLKVGNGAERLDLPAPGGVLIFPNTPFKGQAMCEGAAASAAHFRGGPFAGSAKKLGFLRCGASEDSLAVQSMVSLSLDYARRSESTERRERLFLAILDSFRTPLPVRKPTSRLEKIWREAEERLENMRSLSDVAALAGLSDSTLRSLHRAEYGMPAGRHLQVLRLDVASRLLETTGMSVREIAIAIGYAHPESFSAAFKASRNCTPMAYRQRSQRFA